MLSELQNVFGVFPWEKKFLLQIFSSSLGTKGIKAP